ncbi:MAG TPA: UDP-N-acetylmuramoyl-tripeptide--D-alanyl-D-alanine ligase [Arachidicoccus sp.]|nr:UDP-N-acetylmuramoyl-tripeptide--D-alanyl-D-alanine ligase [Arachidicoccus sp.]
MKIAELYEIYLNFPQVQTDSRHIQPGDLFFALKGPNFNGNLYARRALEAGAAYAIVDESMAEKDPKILVVEDVLTTLQQLARFHRETFDIPFIGITGSNGKTTTKELVHAVLNSRQKTYTTQGNLNNHIGIPLTILKIKKDARIAVIEMGANHLGEIAGYCLYAQPTIGIITNCGKAHLEGFGSEAGVRKGKGELFDYLRATGGTCFAYGDYPYFEEMTKGIKEVNWYCSDPAFPIKAPLVHGGIFKSDPYLEIQLENQGVIVKSNLVGSYNLPNVLCAVALGRYFKISDEDIRTAIENYQPSNSRSQLIKSGTNEIILDAYNANPSSMHVAITNFARMEGEKKILILGGMKELGRQSVEEHQKLLELIQRYSWEEVVLVGPEFADLHGTMRWFEGNQTARDWFQSQDFRHTLILIKGSRSNALEKLLESTLK